MKLRLCSRCKKRPAVVFSQRIENGKSINEGLCVTCAKELGIKPICDMLDQMGISDEELEMMDGQMEGLVEMSDDESDEQNGHAPSIDLSKLFGNLGGMGIMQTPMESSQRADDADKKQNKKDKAKKEDKEPKRRFLDSFCRNVSHLAQQGKLDKVIGRETEITRVMQILSRRQKNNPCLIGEPGVGKTAIAEGLAQRIFMKKVPARLLDKEIYSLDLTALVAGTQFRGQFESRIKGLIDEVKALGNIILVIDEIHSIVGAGDAEGGMNAANILKPALSRGEIQVIGATTLSEYRKYIEKDAALERRLQPVIVNEPSISDTKLMLYGIKKYYEDYHNIKISEPIIDLTVTLSERYITDRFLPDKAIDLLDEAAAHVVLSNAVFNEIGLLDRELKEIEGEEELLSAIDEENPENPEKYEKLAALKVRKLQAEKNYGELVKKRDAIYLREEDLAKVIEIWTGIPATNITENEFQKINTLDKRLKQKIIGQDEAVDAVVRAIKRNRAGVSAKRKPISFIFAGPTGVGKTYLVKTLAADLFDTPESLIRLDMSEFMEKHSVSRIIGSPPGYVGYDEAGQLTEKIRRKPYSVILFDEIEKAHPDVLNILLQVLDDGRITDAHGKEVSFENTVIIMTTNAGSNFNTNTLGFGEDQKVLSESKTERALATFLRPEFINRIDEIITFRSLSEDDFSRIAGIMLGEMKENLATKHIDVIYTENAEKYIAEKSFSQKYGARNMRRFIQRNVEDIVASHIISNYEKTIEKITIDEKDGELDIKCE